MTQTQTSPAVNLPIHPNTPPDQAAIALDWINLDGEPCSAAWAGQGAAPRRLMAANDTWSADRARAALSEGTALVWEGDAVNAQHLLQAIDRRLARKAAPPVALGDARAFHAWRMTQAQRARVLGGLLVPVAPPGVVDLPRAPALQEAWLAAWPALAARALLPLREVQGLIGAWQWRVKGVPVPALNANVHPHYGVYSPARSEYLDLLMRAPLPLALAQYPALDVGTGSGVIAAVLARRGISRVRACDLSARAVANAQDTVKRLGLQKQVKVESADLIPKGEFGLVVFNPPWLPGKPATLLEQSIYDPGHATLKRWLQQVGDHLAPGAEAWLILSDLAEHLGLRDTDDVPQWIAAAGLQILDRLSVKPRHGKAQSQADPLYAARSREQTFLWRLAKV